MTRYQAGDPVATRALIDRLSPGLHRFFLARQLSRSDADDVLQDTWLRIHGARHTWRNGEPLLPWVYAIARYARIDHLRQRSRMKTCELDSESEALAQAPVPLDISEELQALLAPLADREREAIVLLKIVGLSLHEAAGAMACSVGAVKQLVHRAYLRLREQRSQGIAGEIAP